MDDAETQPMEQPGKAQFFENEIIAVDTTPEKEKAEPPSPPAAPELEQGKDGVNEQPEKAWQFDDFVDGTQPDGPSPIASPNAATPVEQIVACEVAETGAEGAKQRPESEGAAKAESSKVDPAEEGLSASRQNMRRIAAHTAKILQSDAPLLLRREQLNSDFRNGIPDLDEEGGKLELVEDGDRKSDLAEDDAPMQAEGAEDQVPKCKGKPKGSPKGKAKAKAKGKAKAKAKAGPKAKAKAGPAPKQKAEPKAQAQAPAKVEGGKAPKSKRHAPAEEEPQPDKKVRKAKGEAGTFAGRYTPKSDPQLSRYNAIKDAFEGYVADKLHKQSSFQAELGQNRRLLSSTPAR